MRTATTSRRRTRAAAVSGAVLLALGVAIPDVATADPNPEPRDPYYYSADELPDFGIPFEVSRDPEIPDSLADLRSGDPSCPAPPLLPATDAGSAEGYTLPVRIKISNGIMLAGYSPGAAHWKQAVPFSLGLEGLSGWVNARVQIPSMKLLTDTDDVTFCDGARLGVSNPGNAPFPEWDWAPWSESWVWTVLNQPDGSEYASPPGTFNSYLYSRLSTADPGRRLDVENLTVNSLDGSLAGIAPNGELQLSVDLDLDLDVVRADHAPGVEFPLGVRGTFTTTAKAPFAPSTATVPWDIGRTPPARHASYLPPKTLAGATEGSSSTLGSTDAEIDVSRLDKLTNTDAKGIATNLYGLLYGIDPWGLGVVYDEPDAPQYNQWVSSVMDGSGRFFPPGRNVADVSVDMTIDTIGLPKGPPSGFGFDE